MFAVVLVVPIMVVRLYASLFLFITFWLFIFHGATIVSLHLGGTRRTCFQIAVSLAFPMVLSLYFIHDVSMLSLKNAAETINSAWLLIPVAFIGYMSWVGADQLNRDHPFRGFLIASTIVFFICYFGHHGIYYEGDPERGARFIIYYKEVSGISAQSGGYFILYLMYVAVSYGAMLLRYAIQISRAV